MPKGNIFYKNSAFSLIKKFFARKVINNPSCEEQVDDGSGDGAVGE